MTLGGPAPGSSEPAPPGGGPTHADPPPLLPDHGAISRWPLWMLTRRAWVPQGSRNHCGTRYCGRTIDLVRMVCRGRKTDVVGLSSLCTPGMGDRFRGGSPRGWEVMPDRADGNCGIVRCRGKEAGGETLDLTNRNRIGGTSTWVSQQRMVSPSSPTGAACRCGRGQGTAVVLIRGGLSGCRRGSGDDHRGDVVVRPAGVSRGRSTSGGLDTYASGGTRAGKGRTSCREDECGGWWRSR